VAGAYRLDEAPSSLGICRNDFRSNDPAYWVIDALRGDLEGKQGRCEDAQTLDELCGRVECSAGSERRGNRDLCALARVSGVSIAGLVVIKDPFSSMVVRLQN
jgi:hypothetical protein